MVQHIALDSTVQEACLDHFGLVGFLLGIHLCHCEPWLVGLVAAELHVRSELQLRVWRWTVLRHVLERQQYHTLVLDETWARCHDYVPAYCDLANR